MEIAVIVGRHVLISCPHCGRSEKYTTPGGERPTPLNRLGVVSCHHPGCGSRLFRVQCGCGGFFVRKRNRADRTVFYGCTKFPTCQVVLTVSPAATDRWSLETLYSLRGAVEWKPSYELKEQVRDDMNTELLRLGDFKKEAAARVGRTEPLTNQPATDGSGFASVCEDDPAEEAQPAPTPEATPNNGRRRSGRYRLGDRPAPESTALPIRRGRRVRRRTTTSRGS